MSARFSAWIFWIFSILLSSAALAFILKFSPNLINTDRINILNPFFENSGVIDGFFFKHGPHFLGLGHLISRLFVFLFGFSATIDLISGLFTIVLLFVSVFLLCNKFSLRPTNYKSLYLPLSIFSLAPCLGLLILPHIHAMLPLFAIWLALSTFIEKNKPRIIVQSVLIFFGFFSGFAYLSIFAFMVIELFRFIKGENTTKLFVINIIVFLLSLAIFIALQKQPKESILIPGGFHLRFFMDVFRNGLGGALVIEGLVVVPNALLFFSILIYKVRNVIDYKQMYSVSIIGFSVFLFVIFSYIGRGINTPDAGLADRYYHTLWLIPFSVFLFTQNKVKEVWVTAVWLLLGCLAFVIPVNKAIERGECFKTTVSNWEVCFEEKQNIDYCNDEVGFEVVPTGEKHKALFVKYLEFRKRDD